MNKTEHELLQVLIDQQLTAVTFLLDYLNLGFNTSYLTIISKPIIMSSDKKFDSASPDFCNQLLKCIGMKVEKVHIKTNNHMIINFNNGYKFFLSLKPEDYIAGEAMIYKDDSGHWWAI